MQNKSMYASMSDEENENERFSDEMGAPRDVESGQVRSSRRKSSESGEDSDAKRKRKSKKKSRKPPIDDMDEEDLMASSRRKRESAKMAASGLVVPPGAPASKISTRELSEEPARASRSSTRPSGSIPRQSGAARAEPNTGPHGIDEAVKLSAFDDDDVFNKGPPQDQGPPQERRSGAPEPTSSTKKKQEINKDFKDVRETGKWGSISKREIWIVGIVGVLVIIGVIVAVVVILTTGGDDSVPAPVSNLAPPPPAPTAAPTARVVLTAQQQLDAIRGATIDNPATQNSLQLLPEDVSFYEGKANDLTAAPVVRAASWIMYDDPVDNEAWLVPRYSLAVLYYATNGNGWTTKDGWMTESSACEWHGVRCDRFNKVIEEIDLSGNNLSGSIPNEVNLVSSLISLWLRRNNLSGTVPSVALGAIPQLSILYLDDNGLNGTIGIELAASGSLRTLFIQNNELTGVLPYEFCPQNGEGGLLEFGIDCDLMECFCCQPDNCF